VVASGLLIGLFGLIMLLASFLAIDPEDVVPPSWYLFPLTSAVALSVAALVMGVLRWPQAGEPPRL
jgi:hypothetical protein